MKIKKAVIAAAGWGTRFLPLTKAQPKEMLPLVNKPIIQYSVEEAIACGVDLVVMVTSHLKRSIEDYFDRSFELEQVLEKKGANDQLSEIRRLSSMVDITYVRQKEQLGLGHALLAAKRIVGNEPFILMLPDDIFEHQEMVLKSMISVFEQHKGSVVAVQKVAQCDISRYGIIKYSEKQGSVYKVTDFIEKPRCSEAPSRLAIMGRYILTPEIFQILEDTAPGKNQEIQLTDGLRKLVRQQCVHAYEFEGERYDAGTTLGWLKTNLALALKDPEIGPKLLEYLDSLKQKSRQSGEMITPNFFDLDSRYVEKR